MSGTNALKEESISARELDLFWMSRCPKIVNLFEDLLKPKET
jgi:hypothetical protein